MYVVCLKSQFPEKKIPKSVFWGLIAWLEVMFLLFVEQSIIFEKNTTGRYILYILYNI